MTPYGKMSKLLAKRLKGDELKDARRLLHRALSHARDEGREQAFRHMGVLAGLCRKGARDALAFSRKYER